MYKVDIFRYYKCKSFVRKNEIIYIIKYSIDLINPEYRDDINWFVKNTQKVNVNNWVLSWSKI